MYTFILLTVSISQFIHSSHAINIYTDIRETYRITGSIYNYYLK